MPIPRYAPGTGNLGPAQPLIDDIGAGYNKGAEFVEHPMVSLRGMLGMAPEGHEGAVDAINKESNAHLNDPANQSFQPVVAPPRRKPMGK